MYTEGIKMTTPEQSQSNFRDGLSSLYFLLICADNVIDPREVRMGKNMMKVEGMDVDWFFEQLDYYSNMSKKAVYDYCLSSLRSCDRTQQLRCIAWMSLIARADGVRSQEELDLIYRIYHDEFNLPMDSILQVLGEIQDKVIVMERMQA
jgi:uncharacterized tellurite resistance protein B-like protein